MALPLQYLRYMRVGRQSIFPNHICFLETAFQLMWDKNGVARNGIEQQCPYVISFLRMAIVGSRGFRLFIQVIVCMRKIANALLTPQLLVCLFVFIFSNKRKHSFV